MNQEIKIFESPQFGQIRTAGTPDEPLFCAIDVCNALGYSNNRDALARHVDENDVVKHDAIDNLGRKQSTAFVNESGLYTLIFGSNLKAAKEFKHWVTSEVLPTIRKTGKYEVTNQRDVVFHDTPYAEIQTKMDSLQSTVDELVLLVRELKAQKPKAIGNSRLVFGIFQPGEQILMKDKRLYDGVAAPFRNYAEVWRAKRKGCPFRTPETQRRWSINAEELERWLTSIGITTQRNKK